MVFMYRMRPVPLVRRPLAFNAQLNVRILELGYPQEAQRAFWMWKETFPQRLQVVCDLLWRFPNDVVPLVCSSQKENGKHHEKLVSTESRIMMDGQIQQNRFPERPEGGLLRQWKWLTSACCKMAQQRYVFRSIGVKAS